MLWFMASLGAWINIKDLGKLRDALLGYPNDSSDLEIHLLWILNDMPIHVIYKDSHSSLGSMK